MTCRGLVVLGAGGVAVAVMSLATVPIAGQSPAASARTAAADKGAAARTPWGDPDLQGIWTSETSTPFERPEQFAGKQFLDEADIAALEAEARQRQQSEQAPQDGDPGTYNAFWFDRGTAWVPDRRTSLIVDPADGKIPWKEGARTAIGGTLRVGPFDKPEDLDTGERCLTDGPTLVPMQAYNMNFEIVQAPGYVLIVHEMFNNRHVIPLDGRPRPDIPQWFGIPRGRWEGGTLVVETTGFPDKRKYRWSQGWRAARPTLKVTERFTRLDAKTIDYRFTIEDPEMFTRPWTAAIPLSQDRAAVGVTAESRLYEYACHEGNHSIVNVLSGSRALERAAAR